MSNGKFVLRTDKMSVSNILYLSSEGDSVEISSVLITQTYSAALPPDQIDGRIRALNKNAATLKTHGAVLEFLKEVERGANSLPLNFYHMNNPNYSTHAGAPTTGAAHECSLKEQITFVTYKIKEKEQGPRHDSWWCSVQ